MIGIPQAIKNDTKDEEDEEETKFLMAAGSSNMESTISTVNDKTFHCIILKRFRSALLQSNVLKRFYTSALLLCILSVLLNVIEKAKSDREARVPEKALADYNIESVKMFEAAYQMYLKQEGKMLCLKPDPTAMYFKFSKIPTILVSKKEMEQERLNGNILPPTKCGRTGNRIIEMGHELDVAMACNKMVTPLTNDFATFFIPCFDFRLGSTKNKTETQPCQKVTERPVSLNGTINQLSPWLLSEKEFQTNALSMQLLNYHLGNAKGWFVGQKCPEQPVPTIVLQLRSGDIMGNNPNPGYGQPPLEYYVKAVEHSRAKNIIIFAEDTNTPLAGELKNYPWANSATNYVSNVTLRSNAPFEEVLMTIMCAEMVVCAKSTLCGLFARSANVRTLYCPTNSPQQLAIAAITGITVEHIWTYNLGNQTYKPYKKWQNNLEQRQEMLSYSGGTFEPFGIDGK